MKNTLKKTNIDLNIWDESASDRQKWQNLIVTGVKNFNNSGIECAKAKRAARYMKNVSIPPERGSKESLTCDQCDHINFSNAVLLRDTRSLRHVS